MTEFGGESIKSIRYTLVSPTTATSGNAPIVYGAWTVTGHLVGVEIGSPAFDSATGSLYIIGSNSQFGQTRTIAQLNGITATTRTFYPFVEFQRTANQGTIASGVAYSATDQPFIAGDAVGLTSSGTYNGSGVFYLYYV